MKYRVIHVIRSLGLLGLADRIKYVLDCLYFRGRNRDFVRTRPDFPVPPADLAFDVYNHVDWTTYHDSGLAHARVFADIIRRETQAGPLSVLEWGCGPGRIIRHLPQLLAERSPRLTGADYNPRSVDWCARHLPGIAFVANGLRPPLPFPDESFDVTYNFSVFTHLSAPVQKAWAEELWRVLKPGGRMVCSTHGDNYRYLLTRRDEVARYEAGEAVTQAGYREGKKWFFAFHPSRFVVDELLPAFEDVTLAQVAPGARMGQDIWVARKPAARREPLHPTAA